MMLMREIDPKHERDEVQWDSEGRWWSAAVNRFSGVTSGLTPPPFVTIVDCTLREGEEVPGVVLSDEQKIALAHTIVAAGFKEMEVGYAGVIDEHHALLKALKREGLPVTLSSHTRIYGQPEEWKTEIDRNLDAGADLLTMVGSASEVNTATTPWLPKEDVPERVGECVAYAKAQGAVVSFGLSDLVRTKLDYILSCYRAAANAGADRLYIYDGQGAATPEAAAYLTHLIRDIAGPEVQIGVHVHDTCGLALASATRAIMAGASVVDAVPVGLGDGAGITASEELVAALEVLYGVSTGIDLSRLVPLCEEVAKALSASVPATKAVVGENQYRHSIDAHVAAILRGAWHSWEVIRPDVLGRTRELQFGFSKLRRGKSGALYAKAQQLGYEPDDSQMDEILERVREITLRKPYANEDEVAAIIREVFGR